MARSREGISVMPALFSGSIAELLHPPASQIPFLDGLRSIAILLVVSGHLSHQFAETYGQTLYSKLPFVANGWIGVDLFFVLSGFLIGGQLWKELRARGSIHVGKFVLRRGFRIWPLYFFTFLCILLFSVAFDKGAAAKQYGWTDIVFITNYYNRGLVMGSWSLCTEEQFYVITPIALFFLVRHLRSVEKFRPLLWGLLLAVPLLRAVVWVHVTGHFFQHDALLFATLFYGSLTHCDGLIVGLIIANLRVAGEKRVAGIANPWVLVAVATTLLIVFHVLQKEIFDFSVLALFFGSFVWLGLQRQIRLFNYRIFYWISRLSFGMYLNHEYMCPWIVHTVLAKVPLTGRLLVFNNLAGIVIVTILSAAIALVTFCFVEHPFLQMRKAVLGRHSNLPAPVALSPVSH